MASQRPSWASLGPALTASSVCDLLGVDATALRVLVDTDQVLELLTADGVRVYPRSQLGGDGTTTPGLSDVIAELASGVDDPWTWAGWLSARTDRRQGRNAFEQLRAGEHDTVVREAGRAAWVWRS